MIVNEIVNMGFNTLRTTEFEEIVPPENDFKTGELPEPKDIVGNNLMLESQPNLPMNFDDQSSNTLENIYSVNKFGIGIDSNFKQSQQISKFNVNPKILESYNFNKKT